MRSVKHTLLDFDVLTFLSVDLILMMQVLWLSVVGTAVCFLCLDHNSAFGQSAAEKGSDRIDFCVSRSN